MKLKLIYLFVILFTIKTINAEFDANESDDDPAGGHTSSGNGNHVDNDNDSDLDIRINKAPNLFNKLNLNNHNNKNTDLDTDTTVEKLKDGIVEDEGTNTEGDESTEQIDGGEDDGENADDAEPVDDEGDVEDEDNSELTTKETPNDDSNKLNVVQNTNNQNRLTPSYESVKQKFFTIISKPGILAGIIGGIVIALLTAILLIMFIIYRMRKKDEGSYALEDTKKPLSSYEYRNVPTKEFYA